MNEKRTLVLHPFFFALYPILTLLAYNINQSSLSQATRSLLFTLILGLFLLLFWRLLTNDWHKAGLNSTLFLFLFFSYGHIVRLVGTNSNIDPFLLHRLTTAVWSMMLIIGSWAIWRLLHYQNIATITHILNIVTAVILIAPLFTLFTHQSAAATNIIYDQEALPPLASSIQAKPDIYYIILDGYARADILAENYHYDNTAFIQALEEKGFYIAEKSHSNYSQTMLSLPSAFNMDYLDGYLAQLDTTSEDRTPMKELLAQSQYFTFLQQQQYHTVAIGTGYEPTELTFSEQFFSSEASAINEFEVMLAKDTWLGTLFDLSLTYERKRQISWFVFDTLKETAVIPGPKFVFAHIFITHFPFVFGPNGERVNPATDYTLIEGNNRIDASTYIGRYGEQISYTNSLLLDLIDHLLTESATPPIIILQADHGPSLYLDYHSLEHTCVKERMSIFNAYYLPGATNELYPEITPVNSFRTILNAYFQTDLPLLSDRSYFSLWHQPYNPIDVTDRLETPCGE